MKSAVNFKEFLKPLKIGLTFYFITSLRKGVISPLVVKKFRYYIDKDTKGVTNVHPE